VGVPDSFLGGAIDYNRLIVAVFPAGDALPRPLNVVSSFHNAPAHRRRGL